jgi:hypothetical protein
MQIGYQDIFETTGFPSFSKTLAYSVQRQLNANWYEGSFRAALQAGTHFVTPQAPGAYFL